MYMWKEENEEIFFSNIESVYSCTKDKKKELLRIMACNLSTKDRKTSISSRPAGST